MTSLAETESPTSSGPSSPRGDLERADSASASSPRLLLQSDERILQSKKNPLLTRSGLWVIYVTVFVDLAGFGLIFPLLPYYVKELHADAFWMGVIMSVFSFCSFVGSIFLGRLSDRIGRRPIILLSLLGSSLGHFMLGVADSITLLCIARGIAGVCGGSVPVAQAYIADTTSAKERAKYMGFLGASVGVGLVLGPALGGTLSVFGFNTSAFVASGIAALNLLVGYFTLKESLSQELKAKAISNPAQHSTTNYFTKLNRRNRPQLLLFAANFFAVFAFVGLETTIGLLAADHFGVPPSQLGVLFALFGVILIIVQGGLVSHLKTYLGEKNMAVSAFIFEGISFVLVPFMPNLSTLLMLLAVTGVFHGMVQPSVPTLLSVHTPAHQQGLVLGIFQSAGSLSRIISPLLMGQLYDINYHIPYEIMGGTLLLACLFVVGVPAPSEDTLEDIEELSLLDKFHDVP